jgi:hypothetical protein
VHSGSRDIARVCAVLAAVAVLLLALAGCAGDSPPGPAPAPCGPDRIEVRVVDGEPDPSSRSLVLTLRNRTDAPCALGGTTPVITLLDDRGAPLPTVHEDGEPAAGRVLVDTVPAGSGVATTVSWRVVTDGAADAAARCLSAAGLRVRLPGGSLDTGEPITACGSGTLVVTPYELARA